MENVAFISVWRVCGIIELKIIVRNEETIYRRLQIGALINRRAVIGIIEKLQALKLYEVMPNGVLNKDYDVSSKHWDQTIINGSDPQFISAPKTAHWAAVIICELIILKRKSRLDYLGT